LGERRLIEAIRRWLGRASPPAPFGIGDDCAVRRVSAGVKLLKADPVVFGRHFDAATAARAAGEKLLKRNLSDVAAMGGRPEAALVSLFLDPGVRVSWLEAFHRGLASCARRHGVSIVGGSVAQAGGVFAASLALLGSAPPRFLTRRGARAGDWIYATGVLGRAVESGHHLSFRPRLAEGAWCARRPEVRAMMDISDGLAKDLPALTPSGLEAAIDPGVLPLRRGADLRAALCDGEDYELAIVLSGNASRAGFERAWRRAFRRTRLTCLGRFCARGRLPSGSVRLAAFKGYEHLGSSRPPTARRK
jgi:thiamine-monophosphate kinase